MNILDQTFDIDVQESREQDQKFQELEPALWIDLDTWIDS